MNGCDSEPSRPVQLELKAVRQVVLDSLPAGSAMLLEGDAVYLISDNAPAYYRLPVSLDVAGLLRTALPRPDSDLYELPKPVKPDFEASVKLKTGTGEVIVAFGSGSLSPQRDGLLIVPLNGEAAAVTVSAAKLYAHLRTSCGIAEKDFNLEAAAVSGDRLYLANRGTNELLQLPLDDFTAWLADPEGAALPAVRHTRLTLPAAGGRATGISGLSELPDGRLLFCASAEATDNWYDDGEVLGSVIGLIAPAGDDSVAVAGSALLTDGNGKALPQKLESLVLLREEGRGKWRILAVADNDNGSSTLFEVELAERR